MMSAPANARQPLDDFAICAGQGRPPIDANGGGSLGMARGNSSRGTAVPKLFWEDFIAGQVTEYGTYEVTAEEIKAFAAEFDPQPMHLDEEAARAGMMGGLCASGWHTCAMMMRIIADGFVLESSSMGATGCEEVKWLAPVRPGDRLRVRMHVIDKRASQSRPEMGFVNARLDVLNAAGVCVMTLTPHFMLGRRPPPERAAQGTDAKAAGA